MYGLILDTASPLSYLLLTKQGKVLSFWKTYKQKKISNDLFAKLQEWMTQHSLQGQIAFIAMGEGPGSFTGTRIGITLAKSLSYGLKVPLLSFCSLLGYYPEEEGPFTVVFDAKSLGFHCLDGKKTDQQAFFENFSYTLPKELAKEKFTTSTWVTSPFEEKDSPLNAITTLRKKEPDFSYIADFVYQKFIVKQDDLSPFSPISTSPSCDKQQNLLPSSQIKASAFAEVKL